MKQIMRFKPKGMNRDLSKANFSPEFSYENKNIRFTTNEANSLMSITNEKGPKLESRISEAVEKRTILGYSTLEDNIILFCKSNIDEVQEIHIDTINLMYGGTPYITYKNVVAKKTSGSTSDWEGTWEAEGEVTGTSYKNPFTFKIVKTGSTYELSTFMGYRVNSSSSLTVEEGITTINTNASIQIQEGGNRKDLLIWGNYNTDGDTLVPSPVALKGVVPRPDHIIVVNDTEIKDFAGDLNFNVEYPIEAVSIYENENTQKVYWTDGLNSPRVIDIKESKTEITQGDVDFAPILQLAASLSVAKDTDSTGSFPSGVIQYAATYINKFGAESNIFWASPLFYISFKERGANQEDLVNAAFKITISKGEETFPYIRLYSIQRTSENSTPICKRLIDLSLDDIESTERTITSSTNFLSSDYFGVLESEGNPNIILRGILRGKPAIRNYSLYQIVQEYGYETSSIKIPVISDENENSTFTYIKSIKWTKGDKRYEISDIKDGSYITIKASPQSDNTSFIPLTLETSYMNSNSENPITLKETYNGKFLEYTDTGTIGDSIDPTELLYVGGESIIAQTISHKDNTLFLGNIKKNSSYVELPNISKDSSIIINFEADKKLTAPTYEGYYAYKSNLDKSNWEITTFKYNEWYRFGIQAQDKTGKWSEPIWIRDIKNTTSIKNIGDTPYLVTASCTLPSEYINALLDEEFVKIRPLVVYPSIYDRECICQGVVCPTVYNMGDRKDNSPYVQASWVFRPEAPVNYKTPAKPTGVISEVPMFFPYRFEHDRGIGSVNGDNPFLPDLTDSDVWSYYSAGQEIQGMVATPPFAQTTLTGNIDDEYFFIDRSIVTLNSPDIEFDLNVQNLDLTDLKFRIVGEIPIHASYTDMTVSTKTPGIYRDTSPYTGKGLLPIDNSNRYFGATSVVGGFQSGFLWNDWIAYNEDYRYTVDHEVYMWHREDSLNNSNPVQTPSGERSAMLDKKKLSILNSSKFTDYFAGIDNYIFKVWEPRNGVAGVSMFNLSELGVVTIKSPDNAVDKKFYYGNIDKIVNITTNTITKSSYYKSNGTQVSDEGTHSKAHGYCPMFMKRNLSPEFTFYKDSCTKDPVNIKYKSTPHAVISFKQTDNSVIVLPSRNEAEMYHPGNIEGNLAYDPWTGKPTKPVEFGDFTDRHSSNDILWVGELYRANVSNRFGGTSKEAIENNVWLPCGEPVELNKNSPAFIKWVGGDTFYQRYDCMKTYPSTFDDRNQLTNILSFMCETRVNIDGRYDRNRGTLTNTSVSPNNFNLINPVYTQKDNFFNYRVVTDKDNIITEFPSTITWSKTKTVGEKVDIWTNITLASTLDLDGDKGPITSLQRFNDQLIAFQDKGISQILYNENMQISTESGVPIEIANSGKVNGKRYLSDNVGCQNKWSICSTPNGIYFIDNLNKSINLFAGEVIDLSKKHGFNSWISSNSKLTKWNPKDFSNFVTFYDNKNKDVLFINNDTCLAYSELLGQFTSFYDYNKVFPVINNLGDTYLGRDSKIYLHNEGEYNKFFTEEYSPFYIEVVANDNPTIDKVFTNIEFTSDTWDDGGNLLQSTFDTLKASNEYQYGEIELGLAKFSPSPLKKKFRVWRANIPRDKSNGRDRMRNLWLNVKLEKNKTSNQKTVLHDLSIQYYV